MSSSPYPITAYWQVRPSDWRAVAVRLLPGLGEDFGPLFLRFDSGVYGFATAQAAEQFLFKSGNRLLGFHIDLPCGFPIQTVMDVSDVGSFEHVEMDLLFALRPKDAEHIHHQFRCFAAAMIRNAGALAVVCGNVREDNDALMDARDVFAKAMRNRRQNEPLPLSLVKHVSWLIAWNGGAAAPPTDLSANITLGDDVAAYLDAKSSPLAQSITLKDN
jgi:hypothetical protein